MSESVYYMDRRMDILVTDSQVVITGRRYYLAQIKSVALDSRHTATCRRVEWWTRGISVVAMLAACGSRLLPDSMPFAGALFNVSMIVLSAGLVALLMLGLLQKQQHVVLLKCTNGTRQEVMSFADRRQAREVVEALSDAVCDYRTGKNANNRGWWFRL